MPHKARHRPTKGPQGNWAIIRENPDETTTTVGRSASRKKAKMSAGIRDSEEKRRN